MLCCNQGLRMIGAKCCCKALSGSPDKYLRFLFAAIVLENHPEGQGGSQSGEMVFAEHPLPALQCAAAELFRLVELALSPKQRTEVVRALKSVGVIGSEHPLSGLQGLAAERLRLVELALGLEEMAEAAYARERVRVVGPK